MALTNVNAVQVEFNQLKDNAKVSNRINTAQHPTQTNTVVGFNALDDSQLTGTIGYRNTAIGVNALRDVANAPAAGQLVSQYG